MSESADVGITTVTSILIITSIVGNSLVYAVIRKNRDMRYTRMYTQLYTLGLSYSKLHPLWATSIVGH